MVDKLLLVIFAASVGSLAYPLVMIVSPGLNNTARGIRFGGYVTSRTSFVSALLAGVSLLLAQPVASIACLLASLSWCVYVVISFRTHDWTGLWAPENDLKEYEIPDEIGLRTFE